MEHGGRDSLSSSRSLLMALGCTDIAARAALCVSPCPSLVVHVSLRINISTVSRRVSVEDAKDIASSSGWNPCVPSSISLFLLYSPGQWLCERLELLSNDDVALEPMHSKCRHAFKLVSLLECPKDTSTSLMRKKSRGQFSPSLNIVRRGEHSNARVVDVFGPHVTAPEAQQRQWEESNNVIRSSSRSQDLSLWYPDCIQWQNAKTKCEIFYYFVVTGLRTPCIGLVTKRLRIFSISLNNNIHNHLVANPIDS